MSGIWMRTRAELRGRWASSVMVVLLIGLAGGVAMTAAAGARRTDTSYPRSLREANAGDFLVSAQSTKGAGLYADIDQLPEVARSGVVDGLPYFLVTGPKRVDQYTAIIASHDGKAGYTIERLHMLSGRAPRPDRPNEMAASLQFERKYHAKPGDRIKLMLFDTRAARPVLGADGKPVIDTFTITGIEVSFDEIIPIAPNDIYPQLFATPALAKRFTEGQLNYDGDLVQLRPDVDPQLFRRHLRRLGAEHPEAVCCAVADERDHHERVQNAIRPEALALAVFALLVGLAGLLAIAQILSRRIFLDGVDYPTLRSVGMSRQQLVGVAAIRGAIVAVAGGAIAVMAAGLASPIMPIGPARIAEPHRGFEINLAILGGGFLLIALLVTTITALAGWRAARAGGTALGTVEVRGADRPSRLAAKVSRAGMSPSVVSGVRFAVEPGRGRTAVPVRTAMVGIIVAIAAITASFTLGANLTRLVTTPAQFGRTWDVELDTGFGALPRDGIDELFRTKDVAAYAGGLYDAGSVTIDGHPVPTVGIDQLRGSVFPTIIHGRAPANDHEIVLGAKSLDDIGASVGDTVSVKTGRAARSMRIVGQAVFPSMGAGSFNPTGLGEGAAMTASALRAHYPPEGTYTFVMARFRPGVDQNAAIHRLQSADRAIKLCPSDQLCLFRTSQLPAELSTFPDIKRVPVVLAGLLIVMGLAVTAHALVTSVQRRRRDLATLKTLGFVRSQVLVTVAAQASFFAAIGLLLGLPLGLAAGRWAWTLFADQLGIPPSVQLPSLAVVLAIPTAILLANIIAAIPGRIAARTQPAVVLRTE